MRVNSINTVCAITALLLFGACTRQLKDELKDPKDQNLNSKAAAAAAPSQDGKIIHEFLTSQGPKFETYSVKAQGGEFRTKSGNLYTVTPNSFVRPDGSPVSGSFELYVKEISTPANMIFADKPTATKSGAPLVSYGEFFVKAEQGGVPLKLRKDSAIKVAVPVRQDAGKRVPMWDGDTSVTVNQSGYNYVNQLITISQTISFNKGVDWTQIPNPTTGFALFDGTSLNFRLDSLIKWRNCDQLASLPGTKTTVLGYFTNFYNAATNTSYTGEEPSMLYFKPQGVNSIIKFYNPIFTPPAGFEGFLSYQNTVPIGLKGTFLAISAVNGIFYAEQKDVTIPTPAPGNNYSTVSFTLAPVTASQLAALIVSMNTK